MITKIPSDATDPAGRSHPDSAYPPSSRTDDVYSDRLFLKALLIMIVRRLHSVGELLAVLEEPIPRCDGGALGAGRFALQRA